MAGYFPNAYNYDPEDIKKKLSAPRMDRSQLTTYTLPSGGQVSLPVGSKLPSYYQNTATPYVPPRTAAQQFDLSQAYKTGYGAPSPTIQQGAGGPYRVAGGVANPVANPPNFFQRQTSNLYTGLTTAFPAIAQSLFGGGRGVYAGQQASPLQSVQNYQQTGSFGGYASRGPNRYFDY